ncbi:CHRD domain-containing protein [Algoriphagus halophilus]|uniref:CHRD domain-containing protein n=1 Tax=Algoriphagus halophilus TaxID=226505 RepID=A0A1N6D2Z6_9BACT|nr:CHRD domain-containing protein [Algoriphagus halophilus]SIN65054.1 CHRD domain-containing protein [Algoriphagus halophilus]
MKTSFQKLALLSFLAFFAFACQNFQEETPTMNQLGDDNSSAFASESDLNARKGQLAEFGAFLIGSEEVPSVSSPGSGAAKISQIDEGTLKFELRVANTSNIAAAHLHYAAAGTNGPVVVALLTTPIPGLSNGLIAEGMIDASKLVGPLAGMSISDLTAEFESGNIYVNLHTSGNPSGELRGQVSMVEASDNKNYGTKLSGANEVPAAMTDATGVAKFNFSNDGSALSFQVNVDGIEDVRFAHIHLAKAGSNGGVIFTLRMDKVVGPVSGVYAKGEIMPANFSGQMLGGDLEILREAFRTGNAYVNVHSDDFPGGELRGQVN